MARSAASTKRRPTPEVVERYFRHRGCTLLDEYTSHALSLRFICSCGNEGQAIFRKFKAGVRCRSCQNQKRRTSQPHRLDPAYVKEYFERHGCRLLGSYVKIDAPLRYVCECGTESTIRFSKFKRGQRCHACGNKKRAESQPHRLNSTSVKQFFADHGCKLLDEYSNNRIRMRYVCKCGRESKISFAKFQDGQRCQQCAGMAPLDPESVRRYFAENGCRLLDEYRNNQTRMRYVCECGKLAKISYANFSRGKRCKSCGVRKRAEAKRLDQAHVKQFFSDRGCALLDQYTNNSTPMRYICECGKKSKITYASFSQGSRCRHCQSRKLAEANQLNPADVKRFFESQGCQLLDKYTDSNTPMRYVCVCGKAAMINWDHFKQGQRCRACAAAKLSGTKNHNWNPDRELVALNKLVKKKYYKALRSVLESTGVKKCKKSCELLGYTPTELRAHLWAHPNWDSVKKGDWHLDHVFPIYAFLEHGIEDPKLINCLENLQPLAAKTNVSKGDDYDPEQFVAWLRAKGVELTIGTFGCPGKWEADS